MPRPREYANQAERQAAYRARLRQDEYEARLRADQKREALNAAISRLDTAIRAAADAQDADACKLLPLDLAGRLQLIAIWFEQTADQLRATGTKPRHSSRGSQRDAT